MWNLSEIPEKYFRIWSARWRESQLKIQQVYVGGPTLAIGYLNRPDLNEQRFIKTPASLVKQYGPRLYRTGDWGYLLSDGSLEIVGRCDSMVKIRGYTVELKVSWECFSKL